MYLNCLCVISFILALLIALYQWKALNAQNVIARANNLFNTRKKAMAKFQWLFLHFSVDIKNFDAKYWISKSETPFEDEVYTGYFNKSIAGTSPSPSFAINPRQCFSFTVYECNKLFSDECLKKLEQVEKLFEKKLDAQYSSKIYTKENQFELEQLLSDIILLMAAETNS